MMPKSQSYLSPQKDNFQLAYKKARWFKKQQTLFKSTKTVTTKLAVAQIEREKNDREVTLPKPLMS